MTEISSPAMSTPPADSSPAQWLNHHGDALFRYAVMLVRSADRAEDLVQETLLAALESHNRFTGSASERTWLIAILRNKAVDLRRKQMREARVLGKSDPVMDSAFNKFGKWRVAPIAVSMTPQQIIESREFRQVFAGCLRQLPLHFRDAFSLRVVEGLDAAEVCRVLELSPANLWTLLSRARERLRRCLETGWFKQQER